MILKRIKPQQLELGMFVEAGEGTWNGKPFWRSRFRLDRPEDVETRKGSDITAVFINTARGNGPAEGRSWKRPVVPTQSKPHFERALQIIDQSKALIHALFQAARMGGARSMGNATEAVGHISECMKDSGKALVAATRLKTKDEHTFPHSIAVTGLRRQQEIRKVVFDVRLNQLERIDGVGYPNSLSGDQISLSARMTSISEVYDALTSRPPYKKAWSPGEATEFMLKRAGQFDEFLLEKSIKSLRLYEMLLQYLLHLFVRLAILSAIAY